jgi:geranylgeranyl pyrophosphate synthase
MRDVNQILEEDTKTVRDYLNSFKEQTKSNLGPFEDVADKLDSLTWEYTRRPWKGLRSILTMETADAYGGDAETALFLAAVMQLEQDWILMHDDFEDKSTLRRGKPALHKMVSADIAINVGDRLRVLTDKLFGMTLKRCEIDVRNQLSDFRYQMLDETTQGQHFENSMKKLPISKISLPAVLLIYDRKTGTYTYELPTGYGLLISKLKPEDILKRRMVFREFGAPFQIQDDYLNLVAEPSSGYGKEFADDILEGKWTIFPERAQRLLKGRVLERHNQLYGNRRASIDDRKEVAEYYWRYGVFDQAMEIQKALWTQARNRAYELIPKNESGRTLLAIMDFGGDRPY